MSRSKVRSGKKNSSPSRWFRANLWLHRWVSLLVSLPFMVLCITGTVLIFHEEIDMAMGVLPPSPGLADEKQPLATAIDNALTAYPQEKVAIIGIQPDDHPGLMLIGTVPREDVGFENLTRRFAYLSTGKMTSEQEGIRGSLTGLLFELHAQWFLGAVGSLIGAFIALLVLISLFSGMVVYGPYVSRVAFGVLRRRGSRLFQLDLHNFMSVTVLGWLLLVSLSGFFLGFGSMLTAAWAQEQIQGGGEIDDSIIVDAREPPIKVDAVYQAALDAAPPDWSVEVIIWPGTTFSSSHEYAVRIVGSGLNKRLFRVVLVDATTGIASRTVELPWYMKAIVLSQPLHFGDYGGLVLKLLWTACAWLTMYIIGNGAWLWWQRRSSVRSRYTKVSV